MENWQRVGRLSELKKSPLQQLDISGVKIAFSFKDGQFSAISGFCNHAGGPLDTGVLEGRLCGSPLALF